MKTSSRLSLVLAPAIAAALAPGATAETLGSVEPIADPSVVDIAPLSAQPLEVRTAFAERLLRCGILDEVQDAVAAAHAAPTIRRRNTHFELTAGGFAGATNPTYGFRIDDTGRDAASIADIRILADSLSFAMSQGSAFLLEASDPDALDFPASYVVLEFALPPRLEDSARLFETVGEIDPALFETDTSGYTQFGRAYLSLQSDVPDAEFIAGYVAAARAFGVVYTPIVGGVPSLFHGGAAFPGNDWVAHPDGAEYLARLPAELRAPLRRIRAFHLGFTRRALSELRHRGDARALVERLRHLACRS